MITPEEIDQRIDQVDRPRSDRRKEAAQKVGRLAGRRATIAAQLEEIDRELGEVLAAAEPDIGVDELAAITDLTAADLTQWLTAGVAAGRKTGRGGGRQKATTSGGRRDRQLASSPAEPPPAQDTPGPPRAGATVGMSDLAMPHSGLPESAEGPIARAG